MEQISSTEKPKQEVPVPAYPYPMAPYPYMQPEDEINLLDLFLVLIKHKFLIMGLVLLAGVLVVIYSLFLPNIYRSEATIGLRPDEKDAGIALPGGLGGLGGMVAGQLGLGGGGSLEKLEVVLKSRELTNRIVEKYELMPVLFADSWDTKKQSWIGEEAPTFQDGWQVLKAKFKINIDSKKNTIIIGIEDENPQTAKRIVDYYIVELSELMREDVLQDAAANQRFFNEQLERTSDVLLKEKIYALLAKEIEKETFARAQQHYGFLVLDPPIVPDLDKKVKPKRSLICILSVFVAFFMAMFLAFFLEFVGRIKTDDPERYQKLVQGLKFWRKGS